MNIYVGNLAYAVTEDQLRSAFGQFGDVARVNLIIDRETGRSKGFGFVEMPDDSAAGAAIQALNGTDLEGRSLKISEARPRERRPRY
jgi:RNA recognition motif-containing protein